MSIITETIAKKRMAPRPVGNDACCVDDIGNIIDQMEINHKSTMELVNCLHKLVTDEETLSSAKKIVDSCRDAGSISGKMSSNICYFLDVSIHPEKRATVRENEYDFSKVEDLEKYIIGNNRWVVNEVILHNAFACVERVRDLGQAEMVIDSHYKLGDIPGNITLLIKVFYENIYHCRAHDFHDFAREFGYLKEDTGDE